jgi:hypothetical protein
MIRATMTTTMTMLAVGFFTLSGVSAMAASKASHHQAKTAVVAQAEGGAPAGDAAKPAKKSKSKKSKVTKDGAKDKAPASETAAPAPAPDKK